VSSRNFQHTIVERRDRGSTGEFPLMVIAKDEQAEYGEKNHTNRKWRVYYGPVRTKRFARESEH